MINRGEPMKNSIKIFALLAIALLMTTSAFAASPWTQEDTYGKKIAGKLDYGVKNLLGGWLALIPCTSGCDMKSTEKPYCPIRCTKKLGMGLINAAAYTVGGALNVATFPIAVDIPILNDGIQL